METLAVQLEFQVPGFNCGLRRDAFLGTPITSVPYLHGTTAVLAARDSSFEVCVFQRMIFHLDRKALVARVERWASRYRP